MAGASFLGTPGRLRWLEWLPVAAGLAVMYVPTFFMLADNHWHRDEEAHGPLILGIAAWLAWRRRHALLDAHPPARAAGYAWVAFGMLVYVLGRSQAIGILEAGSLIPIVGGVILCLLGWKALRALWFPIAFLVFYVPLPSTLVDSVTAPLKHQISMLAELILHEAGYSVARSGVMLTIGPYQMLVADACAGLYSMFSLAALGALYMYLMRRPGWMHNLVMAAAIVPIAFLANLLRVLALMLITFHFGDEAGQGFLHGTTGIFLFLVGLSGLMALDALLAAVVRKPARR